MERRRKTQGLVQAAHYGLGCIFPVVVLDARRRWHRPVNGRLPKPDTKSNELLVVRWTGPDSDIDVAPELLVRAAERAPEEFTPSHVTRFKEGLPPSLSVTTVPPTALLCPWAERPGSSSGAAVNHSLTDPLPKEQTLNVPETVTEYTLPVCVQHRRNPYEYAVSDEELDELLLDLGRKRAASIWCNHKAAPAAAPRGSYGRTSMGFVLMDPTAGPWVSNEHAVLAIVTVGEDGHSFLPNAAAKAAGHRRLGRNYGEAVLVDPHLCGSAGFRYGHSAEVRGQIIGASSQSPDQDLYEAGQLANDFVSAINERHLAWEARVGPGDWLADDGVPHREFRDMVSFFAPASSTKPG